MACGSGNATMLCFAAALPFFFSAAPAAARAVSGRRLA